MHTFLFIYYLIIIYLLQYIYLLPYYLTIYQYFTKVVTYYFLFLILLPYYFFVSKIMLHRCILYLFSVILLKNRKKSANFLQFFLVVYQQVRRNLKKKFVKTLDKIFNCCIFASSFRIKQDNNKKQ